jgi:hypothetical protein
MSRKDPLWGYETLKDFLEDVAEEKATEPYYEDGDYYCNKCGEPWDAKGVKMALKGETSDMTKEEAEKFIRGEGCPSCPINDCKHWGENNPAANWMDVGCTIGHSWCDPKKCPDYQKAKKTWILDDDEEEEDR